MASTRSSTPIHYLFGELLLPPESDVAVARRGRTDPLYRPLQIFALDPALPQLQGKITVASVPWEPLEPGPRGHLFEVESVGITREKTDPLNLDLPNVLLDRGIRPSTSDGRFHRQMVYAVCSSVYDAFFKALGRDLRWGFTSRDRLLLRPFAFEKKNAFYDRAAGELQFGYFPSDTMRDVVYTSLSHDIIAHELTHALLDGLRRHFTIATNPDVLAFHEAFGDLVAIFHHFSYPEVVRAAIGDAHGDLGGKKTILSGIARQFGEGLGRGQDGLRTAIDFKDGVPTALYGASKKPHELGAVLVAAVFDAFTRVFQRKTRPLVRLATGGSGVLSAGDLPYDLLMALADEASKMARQFLVICIRAIDYCPPVDMTFGEFLRAVITADRDLVPDDPWAYREAWLDAFRVRGIFPPGVSHLSEDAIEWMPPETPLTIPALSYAKLQFTGDPARAVSRSETARQAAELAKEIFQRSRLVEFGVIAADDPELEGDEVEPPKIESIRSLRRIGPEDQVVFDLVAEVTQKRLVRRDGRTFPTYGGSTSIIGPEGEVRYVIRKGLRNDERIAAQIDFVRKGYGFWSESGDVYEPDECPFAALHSGDAGEQ